MDLKSRWSGRTGKLCDILIVGNAFTMPEGLHWIKAYPSILEKNLNEYFGPLSVQVINGGVTGYSPTEKLPSLRELAYRYRPDVIIDQFFMTELDWMMQTPDERLQRIGLMRKDGSLISEYWGSLQFPLHLWYLRESLAEVITHKPSTWRYDKALLQYYRTDSNRIYSEERFQKLNSYYRAVADIAMNIGAKAFVLNVPGAVEIQESQTLDYFPWTENLKDKSRYDLDRPWHFLARVAEASNIPVYSLKVALQSSTELPYYASSWHWTEAGHRATADAVVGILIKHKFIYDDCIGRKGPADEL